MKTKICLYLAVHDINPVTFEISNGETLYNFIIKLKSEGKKSSDEIINGNVSRNASTFFRKLKS